MRRCAALASAGGSTEPHVMGLAGMAYPAALMTRTVLRTLCVHDDMMRCGICSDVVCVRLRVTRAATRLRLYKACFRVLVTADGALIAELIKSDLEARD